MIPFVVAKRNICLATPLCDNISVYPSVNPLGPVASQQSHGPKYGHLAFVSSCSEGCVTCRPGTCEHL